MLHLRKLLLARSEWFEQRMLEHAVIDNLGHITPAMHRLFAHIGYKPVRITRLVEALAISRQAVHKMVHEAVDLGLLELVDCPHDRRAKMVQFTADGRAMVDGAVVAMQAVEDELAARIGRDNIERLAEILSMDWGGEAPGRNSGRGRRRHA